MINTLIFHDKSHKREISKLTLDHDDWGLIETDDYNDALKKIRTGVIDAMAIAAEISAGTCMELVSTLHNSKPDAKVYIMMDSETKCDRSKSADRGFIYT